jgi:hypothetical protein
MEYVNIYDIFLVYSYTILMMVVCAQKSINLQ